ncbi:AAA domain-containing protein [Flavobacterium procerum]|uniref:AAA domain-containing protein n=1 Tax=Flavobacterium procerum TaxID=1455569 RepID=A0ABV6BRM5_9FLAO
MEYKKWLTYWKKNLSDSLKSDIDIKNLKHFEVDIFNIENPVVNELGKINKLIDFEEEILNKKKGITNKESENWVSLADIHILISPIKIKPTTENLVYLKDKNPKFPFWFFAKVDRLGNLNVPDDTFPIFQRKFLEPLADERTEFIFGSLENIDKATAVGKEKFDNYSDYVNYLQNVFKLAIDQDFKDYVSTGYETLKSGIILLPNEEINAAVGIIKLYEKILKEKEIPSLLKHFITLENKNVNPPLEVKQFIDSNFLHLGQMGYEHSISISQRKSLYTFLERNDKVFAVNGPPGTGKTTLLQSIVANKIVESAIKGGEAPLILACSTNNQAVTNIIDSFSKSNTREGDLQGRWIPEIDGYATYLSSKIKTVEELKGINYKKEDGEGLFNNVENPSYLKEAKDYFIEKSKIYLKKQILNIQSVTTELRNEIIKIENNLKEASAFWNDYLNMENQFQNEYYIPKAIKDKYYTGTLLNESYFDSDISELKKLEEKNIFYFNNEPFFRKLFCFFRFKSALQNRKSEIRILLRDSLIEETNDFVYNKIDVLDTIDKKIRLADSISNSVKKWKDWKVKNSIIGNPPKNEDEYWNFEYAKIKNKAEPNCFYDELDVSLRHKSFQLALHYWEGRWLMRLETDLTDPNFKKKGIDAVKNRWKRQAMLTPCFVSTFYMAPKFFSYYKFFRQSEDGTNLFDNPPLYDFVDLLLVDEAGQVTPEVGVATFSLAKQAVIVGDVKQIEPIWNVSNKIDIGNLKKSEIIKSYDDGIYEKEYDFKGFLSSTGSIMKIAQNACNVKSSNFEEKGLTLLEHRRCYNEIIEYCNVLAYNGQLKALKGKAPNDLLFPPMYCIHVEGKSKILNSSRYNQNEVDAIVNWLISNKKSIESKYKNNEISERIENIIGIITPFVGQKNTLRNALKNAGFDVNLLKLGTVHALQGAERPIVLFSMVYGKNDSGTMFFDRDNKPNMLNVAVSRAKDNFIVFANTEILNKQSKIPSGILANHLIYNDKV